MNGWISVRDAYLGHRRYDLGSRYLQDHNSFPSGHPNLGFCARNMHNSGQARDVIRTLSAR